MTWSAKRRAAPTSERRAVAQDQRQRRTDSGSRPQRSWRAGACQPDSILMTACKSCVRVGLQRRQATSSLIRLRPSAGSAGCCATWSGSGLGAATTCWRRGGGDTSAEGSTVDCTGRRVSAPDEAADESVCRQRLRAWLLQRLRPLEADIVLAHRWDGESFRAACALHGVFSGHAASSLQRKILRFLSNKAVQRAYLLWLHGEDVPWA